jgi:hypothetical protein
MPKIDLKMMLKTGAINLNFYEAIDQENYSRRNLSDGMFLILSRPNLVFLKIYLMVNLEKLNYNNIRF